MRGILSDLRFGLRMLAKRPAFTAIAVFVLAVGIGANTAIFGVVEAVLFRPLPYSEPDRLVVVNGRLPGAGVDRLSTSPIEFLELSGEHGAFASVAASVQLNYTLTGIPEPERLAARAVSANFLATLGVEPALGRSFNPEATVLKVNEKVRDGPSSRSCPAPSH